MIRSVTNPPDPARIIEGLRDTGYDFNTAMCDIIDNSIAANASRIFVKILMDFAGEITVFIADNGIGMNEDGLIDAMKYGSPKRPDPKSLGKFGLGLKTASTAFCRCLSVVSRPDGDTKAVKACWDLDHIVYTVQDWELLLPEPTQAELDLLDSVSENSSGTVVVWEKSDRILTKVYSEPGGSFARKALEKTIQSLKEYVAMVYQRFLDPEDSRDRNVDIWINDGQIDAWDPFCKNESSTQLVAEEIVEVEDSDGSAYPFTVKAYVLPRTEEFSDKAAAKKAKISNDYQGIYIYRENRLIHYADWLGMYSKEPHSSLLRVEFSFDHKLDDAFNVDIKKSRILLDDALFNWLKDNFLPAPRRAANERYRMGVKTKVEQAAKSAHDSSNTTIGSKEAQLNIATVEVTSETENEAQITNKFGTFRIKIAVSKPSKPGEVHVQPVESITDGVLWEPCIIEQHHAVRINTSHPYYHKVYVPNHHSGVIVQGMDSLLWALCEAELGTVNDSTKTHFSELRYEVSRLLRRLVEDLPDPELADNE